jgi:hypothetical protein
MVDSQNSNFRYCGICESIVIENGRPIILPKNKANFYLSKILDNAKIEQKKTKNKIAKKAETVQDYIYSNNIIDRFKKHLTRDEQWALFADLFSVFPINPEYLQDYRVVFIVRYIGKIRAGIKNKIKANNKPLKKSKGYKSQNFYKDHETAKEAIQIGYYNALKRKKDLTPYYVILSALLKMRLEKRQNAKIDIIGWKKRRGQVFASIFDAKIEDKKENIKADKFEQLKTTLLDYMPENKKDRQWQTVFSMAIFPKATNMVDENNKPIIGKIMSKKEIAIELGLSKRRIAQILKDIPADFKEYRVELLNYCTTYNR